MRQKGFTLIELLAVIILISIVVTISSLSISKTIKKTKVSLSKLQEASIIDSFRLLGADNVMYLPKKNKCKYITLDELYEYGYIEDGIINPKNNELYSKIYVSVCADENEKYTYEIGDLNSYNRPKSGMNPFFLAEPDLYNNNLTPIVYVRLTYADSNHTGTPTREILNGTEVITATSDNEVYEWQVPYENDIWYDYPNQMWANAVILDNGVEKNPGDTVNVDLTVASSDAVGMFVWIPRYSYTLKCENDNLTNCYGNYDNAEILNVSETRGYETRGMLDVRFVSTDVKQRGTAKYTTSINKTWYTLPAFSLIDNENIIELDGLWVGKFEISAYNKESGENIVSNFACNSTECNTSNMVRSLPNLKALVNNTASSLYYLLKNVSNNYDLDFSDLHMIKSSEWSTAAYLSQSIYGKYGNMNYEKNFKNVYRNNSYIYITGSSNANTSYYKECYNNDRIQIQRGNDTYYACQSQLNYDYLINNVDGKGSLGAGASTTGNIYGIYDMSGSAYELAMFNADNHPSQSDFTEQELSNMSMKYIDKYDLETYECNGESCLGHGFDMLSSSTTFSSDSSFIVRGSTSTIESIYSIFSANQSIASGGRRVTTRIAIFKKF